MAKCNWNYDECEAVATTTLKKNSGELVQLCEHHRDLLIKLFKKVADGSLKTHRGDTGEAEANHWFVLNKIPV